MGIDEQGNTGSRKPRTRKAEIVSGVTVVLSVPLLALAFNIYKELRQSQTNERAELQRLLDAEREFCLDAIHQEKERAEKSEEKLERDIRELRSQTLTLKGRR